MYYRNSHNNTFTHITLTNNSANGIYTFTSNENKISNITSTQNQYGIYLHGNSASNTITNCTFKENLYWDGYFRSSCSHVVTNIIGSGGREIKYYNYSINIENKTYSELVLCGASGSNITNVTIIGSDSLDNNALHLIGSENITLNNINSSNNYYGINFRYTDYSTVNNSYFIGNNQHGIQFDYSTYNNVTNSTLNSNSNGVSITSSSVWNRITNCTINSNTYGIYIQSTHNNTFTGIFASGNAEGIRIETSGSDNTLVDSTIMASGSRGIFFVNAGTKNTIAVAV